MSDNRKILEPEAFAAALPQLLEADGQMPLVITGSSMTPFLVHGRDTVYLSRPHSPFKRGDMIFYRRQNGQYVLHRICKVTGGSYTLVGDAQQEREPGIRDEQVLAVVTSVCRKGKLLKKGSFWWEFFRGPWLWLLPVRPWLQKAYTLIRKR